MECESETIFHDGMTSGSLQDSRRSIEQQLRPTYRLPAMHLATRTLTRRGLIGCPGRRAQSNEYLTAVAKKQQLLSAARPMRRTMDSFPCPDHDTMVLFLRCVQVLVRYPNQAAILSLSGRARADSPPIYRTNTTAGDHPPKHQDTMHHCLAPAMFSVRLEFWQQIPSSYDS